MRYAGYAHPLGKSLEGAIRNIRYRLEHGTGYSEEAKATMRKSLAVLERKHSSRVAQSDEIDAIRIAGDWRREGPCGHLSETIAKYTLPPGAHSAVSIPRIPNPEYVDCMRSHPLHALTKMSVPPWAWALGGGLVVYLLVRR